MNENYIDSPFLVGWREWASLPTLGIPYIKVKIDTGAKTSSLHAFDIEITKENGVKYATFSIHPLQNNNVIQRISKTRVIGIKAVKSSNGHSEKRYVINTLVQISHKIWSIDVNLTNRDIMKHRMLLGRDAMATIIVDPSRSFCQGKIRKKQIIQAYEIIP